jgi:cell division protein FtsL
MSSNASLVLNNTMKNLLNETYYKNYTCGYWDCLNSSETSPMFLISEKSQHYWSGMAYTTLIISLLLIALLILLTPKKQSVLFTTGTVLVLDALPLLAFQKIFSWFPAIVSQIGEIFFSQSNYVIIRMIALGAALIVAGLIIELFLAGFKIYNLFHRKEKHEEEKKEIKEEVIEEIKEKQKVSKVSKQKKDQDKNLEDKKKTDKKPKNDNRRK